MAGRQLLDEEQPVHECDAEVHALSSAQYAGKTLLQGLLSCVQGPGLAHVACWLAVSDSTLERCSQQCDSKPDCMMACLKKQAEHHYHAKLALKPDAFIKVGTLAALLVHFYLQARRASSYST